MFKRHTLTRQKALRLWTPSSAAVLVVALVAAIDGLALLSILAARKELQTAAVAELTRQSATQAKALEALLATLRADLAFLATAPQLRAGPESLATSGPLQRRWARLEAEGTLLLFAGGHPSLVSLELFGPGDEHLAAVARPGRPDGRTPEPRLVGDAPQRPTNSLFLKIPVEGGRQLFAVVDAARLLSSVLPSASSSADLDGVAVSYSLVFGESSNLREGSAEIETTIDTRGWLPNTRLFLRRDSSAGLLTAVERLGSRWRFTLTLNLLVISLGLPLAIFAVRAARQAAAAAAEEQHAEHRRQLERGMWRQERLATVGRMAAGIAHEINNPLTGVNNHLAILDEELATGDLSAARQRSPRVRQGLDRIREIVQRVLRLSHPGSGAVEEVDLETLARQTIDLLSETEGGAVELSVARDDPRGLVVEGEQVMLGQLLTNLLLNALSWGAGEPVKVRLTHDAEHCSVTVFDQGPGIDPAIADRIFEPFVSGRSSTGLGLAVSLGIAHQHGGTIEASNRESGGARFALRLPRSFSPPRDSTTPARAEPPVS